MTNRLKLHIVFWSFTALLVYHSCVEPFEVETAQSFVATLVVDARLTDEQKRHEILLSRLRPFEIDSVVPERNATVSIIENSGNTYNFVEDAAGRYVSTVVFGAVPGQTYQLKITTSNGATYSSSNELMPENVAIADLKIQRRTNDLDEDGVAIVLDNSSLGNQPRYFRYDYEENYEIRAPNWDPFTFDIIDSIACSDGDPYEVGIKLKNSEKGRICYGQNRSTDIILAATEDLDGNSVSDFEVRFVSRENYILMHRYSIKVTQYSQSADAHAYYQGLFDFSTSESVFSEVQPGFLAGNIFSETDTEENVIGYFETAPTSSQRVFFNYEDLFPNEPLPEYPVNCGIIGNPQLIAEGYHCTLPPNSICDGNCQSPLIEQIQGDLIVFVAETEPYDLVAPLLTLPFGCGDCTKLGSDVKPEFWIEE